MKIFSPHPDKLPSRRISAFSLVEMMVALSVFLGIFVGVMVGLQIFGLRVYTLAATKLSATADARKSVNALREQIRSAKIVYVGNYSSGVFSRITNGLPQTGNALQLYFSDVNDAPSGLPVVYYQTSTASTNALYSISNSVVTMLANYVTNYYVFTAENYQATPLTTYDNNPVVCVTLQFYQWEYPIGFVGTNGINAYNFYRLQTRVSRRAKD